MRRVSSLAFPDDSSGSLVNPLGFGRERAAHSRLCDPSQSAGVLVCLHPQKYAAPDFCAMCANGVNDVVLCDPSQNGWFFDSPQAHQ
jgi:hypothetical protein